MKVGLCFLVVLLSLAEESKGQLCEKAIPIDVSTNFQDNNDLTESTIHYPWSCRNGNLTGSRIGVLYTFTTNSEPQPLKISTCYPHTNFPAIVRIFGECNELLTDCGQSRNDDPEGVCGGILTRITFEPQPNKQYFILISSASDVAGLFTLTVKPFDPSFVQNNCFFQLAFNLQIPSVIDERITEDCTIADIPGTDLSIEGRWYTFTALSKSIRIDTCNKYTSFPTTIHLFKFNGEENEMVYMESNSNGCGTLASLIVNNLEEGQLYYFVIAPTGGILKQQRSFQLHIYEQPEYGDCDSSFGITQTPFYMYFNISDYPITNFTRSNGLQVSGKTMYFSMAGDENKYVFTTFYTKYYSGQTETIILLSDKCSNLFVEGTFQGKNEYQIIQSNFSTNNILRVICIREPCDISVSMISISSVTNDQCEQSHEIDLEENESYSQIVGAGLIDPSFNGCSEGGESEEMRGSWYHFKQNDSQKITIGVTPYLVDEYMCYIEIHSKCNSTQCLGVSYSTIDVSEEDFYVFATTYTVTMPAQFGYFLFWAMKNCENAGKFPSTAICVDSIPYTKIISIPYETKNYCSQNHIGNYQYGIWFKYFHDSSFKYTASTCGTETNLLTNIEVVSDITGPESLDCVNVISSSCGFGHSIDILIEKNVNTYIGVIANNSGVARFSLFFDQKATDSSCKFATIINESRNIRGYTTRGFTSESRCRGIISLKGIWYMLSIEQPANITIQINASSSFKTAIEVYESCQVIYNESVPKACSAQSNCKTAPIGNNGCILRFRAEKGNRYVFVGGINANEYGIFEGYITIDYDPFVESESDDKNDSPVGWLIYGAIVGVIWVISIICVIVLITTRKKKEKGENEHLKKDLIKKEREVNIKMIIDD